MKKVFGISTFLLSTLTLVSAQGGIASGLSRGMSQIIGGIEGMLGPFFSAILGGGSGMLFEKVLFLSIILATVYVIIKQVPTFSGNKYVIWIISISVSLLATRFMSGDLLSAMMLPYTTLGVALTAGLPLIIFFYFVQTNTSKTMRKLLWIFYIVIFTSIWSIRYNEIGIISYIYLGSAIIGLILFMMDGTIQRARIKQKYEENSKAAVADAVAKMKDRITQLQEWETAEHMDKDVAQHKIKKIRKQIDDILKRA